MEVAVVAGAERERGELLVPGDVDVDRGAGLHRARERDAEVGLVVGIAGRGAVGAGPEILAVHFAHREALHGDVAVVRDGLLPRKPSSGMRWKSVLLFLKPLR